MIYLYIFNEEGLRGSGSLIVVSLYIKVIVVIIVVVIAFSHLLHSALFFLPTPQQLFLSLEVHGISSLF